MLGQMMHMPLTIGSMIDHAARFHAAGEIVSVETKGGVENSTWGEVGVNSHRLACANWGWSRARAVARLRGTTVAIWRFTSVSRVAALSATRSTRAWDPSRWSM